MKIVLSCSAAGWGGTERMAELLALGLTDRGHEVILFCRPGSELHQRLGASIPTEPVLGGADFHPVTIARARAALRRHHPDVVLTNTEKDPRWTGVAARLLGIPVVHRQEIDEAYRDRLYYRLIYGWIPSAIIVNSQASRRSILESVDWVDPARLLVLPNGVEADSLRAMPRADLGMPDDAVVFGFLGRWEGRKGIREVADAWPRVVAALPHAHLVIAGWGPDETAFRSWLAGATNVHWLGFRKDAGSVMKALDVFVAPSHYEGFGLVLAEAMAVGTPVITTLASSMPEIVTDRVEGRVVPVKDAAALAKAMIELGSDADLRARMGQAGVERVNRDFTHQVMLDRHEEVLRGVVG